MEKHIQIKFNDYFALIKAQSKLKEQIKFPKRVVINHIEEWLIPQAQIISLEGESVTFVLNEDPEAFTIPLYHVLGWISFGNVITEQMIETY